MFYLVASNHGNWVWFCCYKSTRQNCLLVTITRKKFLELKVIDSSNRIFLPLYVCECLVEEYIYCHKEEYIYWRPQIKASSKEHGIIKMIDYWSEARMYGHVQMFEQIKTIVWFLLCLYLIHAWCNIIFAWAGGVFKLKLYCMYVSMWIIYIDENFLF